MADPFDTPHTPDVEHLLTSAPLPTLASGHEARLSARLASAASATQPHHATGPHHATAPLGAARSFSLTWAAVAAGLLCVVALDLALPLSHTQHPLRTRASSPAVPVFFTRTSGSPTLDITTWAPRSAPLTQGHP